MRRGLEKLSALISKQTQGDKRADDLNMSPPTVSDNRGCDDFIITELSGREGKTDHRRRLRGSRKEGSLTSRRGEGSRGQQATWRDAFQRAALLVKLLKVKLHRHCRTEFDNLGDQVKILKHITH